MSETCERCGEALGDGRAVACSTCGAPHHQDCWRAASGCAAQDCEGGRPVKFKAVQAGGAQVEEVAEATVEEPAPVVEGGADEASDDADAGVDVTFGPRAIGPLVLHVRWGTGLWWAQAVGGVLAGAGLLGAARISAGAGALIPVGLVVLAVARHMRGARLVETAFDPDRKAMLRRAGSAVAADEVQAETAFRDVRMLRVEGADEPVPSWSRPAFMSSMVVLGIAGFVFQVFRPVVHPVTVVLAVVGAVLLVLGCPWFLHFLTASRQPLVVTASGRDGSTVVLCDPIVTPEERKLLRAMVTRLEGATPLRFRGAEKLAAKLR